MKSLDIQGFGNTTQGQEERSREMIAGSLPVPYR